MVDDGEPAGESTSPDRSPTPPRSEPVLADVLALGLTMAILVGGGLGLGLLVDSWLGSSPIATLVGLGLGIFFAGVAFWDKARRYL